MRIVLTSAAVYFGGRAESVNEREKRNVLILDFIWYFSVMHLISTHRLENNSYINMSNELQRGRVWLDYAEIKSEIYKWKYRYYLH